MLMTVKKMYRRAKTSSTAILLGSLLAGCSTVESVRGPDGTPHRLVHCRLGLKDCYQKAAEICGKYRVIQESGQARGHSDEKSEEELALLIKCEK